MNNEEAIERLTYIKTHDTDPEDYELFDLAIKALEKSEVKGDLISREALKKALINAHINMALTFDISTFNYVMNTIDNAPTVEAERKSDNLPSCNSCLHNGTWDCIKCKGFDKYERR